MSADRDYIWKRFYEQEFLRVEFPDHKKGKDESFFEYFKRSFVGYYKRMRFLLRGIIYETNQRSDDVFKQPTNYLKPFIDRKIHKLVADVMGYDLETGILSSDVKLSF
jgi:hypothetical protein